jgi:hypothetical protein
MTAPVILALVLAALVALAVVAFARNQPTRYTPDPPASGPRSLP